MRRPVDARLAVGGGVLLAVAIALLAFHRTLSGGLLSDDYLLRLFASADLTGADWGAAWADFGRPWLGFDAPFFRPLLSLTFAFDIDRAGGVDPATLHQTNLLLHLVTTAAAAWLCALHAPRRRAWAAALGGMLVALHPVAVEPVAWLAARNSELEVTVRTLCLLAFALALRQRGRRRSVALASSWLLAMLALTAKESALILPVSLLALDLLHGLGIHGNRVVRGGLARAAVLRRQLAFVPLWCGYLAWRTVLFGAPIGAPGGGATAGDTSLVERAQGKLTALFAPHTGVRPLDAPPAQGGSTPGPAWFEAWFDGRLDELLIPTAVLLLLGLALLKRPLAALLAALWIALHTAPTFALQMTGGLSGSRMVYGALPALAILLVSLPLDGRRHLRWIPRPPAILPAVIAAALLLGLQQTNRLVQEHYRAAWTAMAGAERGIAELLETAPSTAPLALTAMPQPRGVPPCNANAWFPFAERPVQERDAALVTLGHLTVTIPGSEALAGDAAAVRVLRRHGSPVLAWDPGRRRFLTRRGALPGSLPALTAVPGANGEFRFATPVDAEAVDLLRIRSAAPAGGVLSLRTVALPPTAPALPAELIDIPFGPGEAQPDGTTLYEIDLTRGLGAPAFATVGLPLTGFGVRWSGDNRSTGPQVSEPRAVASMPSLPAPFAGGDDGPRRLTIDGLLGALRLPTEPLAEPLRLRLVLLGPVQPLVLELAPPGRPSTLPTDLAARLRLTLRLSRKPWIWCYLEARAPQGRAGHARSPLVQVALQREPL